jgi:hypothetical protein
MSTEPQHLLYHNKRTFLLWFIWGLAIGMLGLTGWLISFLTNEQLIKDFGSVKAGRIFQAGLLLIGSVFIWPMVWLSNKYVVEIKKGSDLIIIKTWRIFGPKIYTLETDGVNKDVTYHEGRSDFSMTNAPYLSFRANNKKFIIDMQGAFPLGEDALIDAMNLSS